MEQRTVFFGPPSGPHARPAALVSQAAGAAGVAVTAVVEGRDPVDASSMLMLMTLGVVHGTSVILAAEGEAAEEVLDVLTTMLARDLDAS